MRAKRISMLSFCILLFFILTIASEQQKFEWKGKIEEKDGIVIVKNPKGPIYGEGVFELEEELTIGGVDADEKHSFSHPVCIVINEEENIFVLDFKEYHIKVFNSRGEYIRTIGKKGQGPGELSGPIFMCITPHGEIMVNDIRNRRFTFFSSEGNYVKDLSTAKINMSESDIDSKGNIIGSVVVPDKENPRYELRKFDSELNHILTFNSAPFPWQLSRSNSVKVFTPQITWTLTKDDHVVFGYPEKYEIKLFDKEGNLKRIIVKKYDPIKIREEDKKRIQGWARSNVEYIFPRNYPPYSKLKVDDNNRIFVAIHEKAEGEKKGTIYDVFDQDGRYIAKILLQGRPMCWKNDKLYTITADEEEFLIVKRYRVKWNIDLIE